MKKASLAVALLALSGCGVPGYVKESNAPVILRITGFTPPIVDSDVIKTDGVFEDEVAVALAVRSTNPNVTVPQVPMAVFLERYEVRYRRSDGRNVEGVDVPYAISGPMAGVIDAQTSGSTAFQLEIVRRQAKFDPPLRNLRGSSGGGAIVLTVIADVTIYGRTTAGQLVTTSASVQIDFADFGG
jgi:hypothetical protein